MNMNQATVALDPASLTAFTATLAALPREEIRNAKILYIRNAIVDFEMSRSTGKTMLIVMGVLCIIPVFIVVFIPALIAYRRGIEAGRQKIENAIEVWREELGTEAETLLAQVRPASGPTIR
jgi:hypothetical protein